MERLAVKQTAWDLSPLFQSDDDPKMEARRKEVFVKSYAFINKWKDRGDYLERPEILKEALDEYEAWQRNCGADGDEGYYFSLRSSQDENDPKLKARLNKIH
ncbi:MAG: hypothetical protein HYT42_01790, partial [Candidatus Sungbacteria bacterium]|nr:hypothetical protein [Candidatus Sungbacteria bacterium]